MNALIMFLLLLPCSAIAVDALWFVLTGTRTVTRPRCPRPGQVYFTGWRTYVWDGRDWVTENQLLGD